MRPTPRAVSVVLFLLGLTFFIAGMAVVSNGGRNTCSGTEVTVPHPCDANPGSTGGGVALFLVGASCVAVSTWLNRQRR